MSCSSWDSGTEGVWLTTGAGVTGTAEEEESVVGRGKEEKEEVDAVMVDEAAFASAGDHRGA